MAFGSRLAGGCTSGHGISGTMQLSVGSWIAVICFFAGGIVDSNADVSSLRSTPCPSIKKLRKNQRLRSNLP